MSLQDVKNFLAEHNSFLQYYADFYPESGVFMEASEIIWQTSQQFQINPKFLLTLLEKEQGLISFQKPAMKRLDWAMGYAVCDKCRLSHPLIVKFKGFAKQVYGAAEKIRNDYLADLEKYGKITNGFGPGIAKKVDKQYKITPANNATAVLYTYTPHIKGNQSFYVLWKNWFSNIKYPDGSLLQNVKSGAVYLIDGGKKRPFITETAFTSRFHKNQLVETTSSFLSRYETGEPITDNSNPPAGDLVQLKTTGGVYWVSSGIKYPILDKSILKTVFSGRKPIKIDESELKQYVSGEPVKFKDGTLVKSKNNSAVYFISDGKLRPIPSEEIFLAYNWKWGNVVATTDKILALYETGAPITMEGDGDGASLPEIDGGTTQTCNEASDAPLLISTNNQP